MEFRILSLFIIFSLFSLQATVWGEGSGSVFFIDGSSNQFLRPRSSNDEVQHPPVLLQEVVSAVSVLLGFAPPPTLSAASSLKLNEVLVPNPFNRPRAVFFLEVNGISDLKQIARDNEMFSNGFRSTSILHSEKAHIQLPNEGGVSVVSLDEPLENFTDKEISDFASLIGGSYAPDRLESLKGMLTSPLANGAVVNLHLSKKSESKFILGLLSLIRNVKKGTQMHEDLSQGTQRPAELLIGCFNGIKVLQEQYGAEGIAQHGVELFLTTLTKIFSSLQEAYKGQIVGVIHFHVTTPQELGKKFDVIFASPQAARWLAEAKGENAINPKMLLVRRTLAWVTGVLLLISTVIGIYYLLNMPLTKDTLLYSNVKLD